MVTEPVEVPGSLRALSFDKLTNQSKRPQRHTSLIVHYNIHNTLVKSLLSPLFVLTPPIAHPHYHRTFASQKIDNEMKKSAKLFLGLSVAAIGVLWILNVTGVIGFDIFFRGWWTLLLILPSIAAFINRPNLGAFWGVAVGVVLLLQAQGLIDWSIFWKLCLAVIFIAFGCVLIFSKDGRPENWNRPEAEGGCETVQLEGKNILRITSAFGEQNRRVEGEPFEGACIDASFGSVRLDLRNASINEDVRIDIKAKFAGVGIYLPDDVAVEVYSNTSFGGVNDKTAGASSRRNASHTIHIFADCNFAGVEIR